MSSMVVPRSVLDLMADNRNHPNGLFNQQPTQGYDLRLLQDMGGMTQAAGFMTAMNSSSYSREVEDNILRLSLAHCVNGAMAAADRGAAWSANRKKRSDLGGTSGEETVVIDPPKRRHTIPSFGPMDEGMPGMMMEKEYMELAVRPPHPHHFMPAPMNFVQPPPSSSEMSSPHNWSSSHGMFDISRSISLVEGGGMHMGKHMNICDISGTPYSSQRSSPHDMDQCVYFNQSSDSRKYDYPPYDCSGGAGSGSGDGRFGILARDDRVESCGSRCSGGSPEPADEDPPVNDNLGGQANGSNASSQLCAVCGDLAAGFHCGAYVCEACKVSVLFVCVTIVYYLLVHQVRCGLCS